MADDTLFITGAQRSGTTLMDKLLGSRPDTSILSQPFPLLFVDAKRSFIREIDAAGERYPLGHLFLDRHAQIARFPEFLRQWRTSAAHLTSLFAAMADYSGQWTRFDDATLRAAFGRIEADDDFATVVAKLDHLLAPRSGASWFGSKETNCEEYAPALLDAGFRCLIVIRDPRDAIASLNHGRGAVHGGEIKPTLFNIRAWRKSVAFAIAMSGHRRFAWCRYEDVVSHVHLGELHDGGKSVWRGNSSYGERRGVDASSVGAYKTVLPPSTAAFIEATCLPELQFLGYQTTMRAQDAPAIVQSYAEPYADIRRGMENDEVSAANASLEIERLERVSRPTDAGGARWFLFEAVHARLRAAFTP